MIKNVAKLVLLLLPSLPACKSQINHENKEIIKAKWYFYSFSNGLVAYDQKGKSINPLSCEIMVTSIVNTKDTSTVYFRPFFQDSSNLCTYKPYDLLGGNGD